MGNYHGPQHAILAALRPGSGIHGHRRHAVVATSHLGFMRSLRAGSLQLQALFDQRASSQAK